MLGNTILRRKKPYIRDNKTQKRCFFTQNTSIQHLSNYQLSDKKISLFFVNILQKVV